MLTLVELHAQNHEITELSNVFLISPKDRSMCDTNCARDVFFQYKKCVKEHIELVDQKLCGKLIAYSDSDLMLKALPPVMTCLSPLWMR